MRAGSQPPSDWWTATATIRLAQHPRLPPHFRACDRRCRTDVDARRRKLKGHRRVPRFLRREGTNELAVQGSMPLPYSISFHESVTPEVESRIYSAIFSRTGRNCTYQVLNSDRKDVMKQWAGNGSRLEPGSGSGVQKADS